MNSIEDFLALLRDKLGLPITADELGQNLDQVTGWDSVHLLSLLGVLEQQTGHSLPLADALEAPSLEAIFSLVATG